MSNPTTFGIHFDDQYSSIKFAIIKQTPFADILQCYPNYLYIWKHLRTITHHTWIRQMLIALTINNPKDNPLLLLYPHSFRVWAQHIKFIDAQRQWGMARKHTNTCGWACIEHMCVSHSVFAAGWTNWSIRKHTNSFGVGFACEMRRCCTRVVCFPHCEVAKRCQTDGRTDDKDILTVNEQQWNILNGMALGLGVVRGCEMNVCVEFVCFMMMMYL